MNCLKLLDTFRARFRHRPPTPPKLPTDAWINKPSPEALIRSA